ncbi:hypothetical protein OTSKATO_0308 [Orientia tsutsugamushi str. Kato PP]|nr:hypothetical protein OTSKATO_0308 [Orientia tsutsugamushi str. Kato PP]
MKLSRKRNTGNPYVTFDVADDCETYITKLPNIHSHMPYRIEISSFLIYAIFFS